jgi:hypothetical protein
MTQQWKSTAAMYKNSAHQRARHPRTALAPPVAPSVPATRLRPSQTPLHQTDPPPPRRTGRTGRGQAATPPHPHTSDTAAACRHMHSARGPASGSRTRRGHRGTQRHRGPTGWGEQHLPMPHRLWWPWQVPHNRVHGHASGQDAHLHMHYHCLHHRPLHQTARCSHRRHTRHCRRQRQHWLGASQLAHMQACGPLPPLRHHSHQHHGHYYHRHRCLRPRWHYHWGQPRLLCACHRFASLKCCDCRCDLVLVHRSRVVLLAGSQFGGWNKPWDSQ